MVKASAPGRPAFPGWLAAALALAVLAGYWPALRAGFIYDDRFFVTENRSVHSLANVPSFFSSPKSTTASVPWNDIWRPLRNVSYALDHAVWDLRPFGFHLTNLLLHLVNCLLVAAVAQRFWPGGAAPLLAGMVFALHPVQSEAVAWVSGRDDLLVVAFLLAAWLSRMRYQKTGDKTWLGTALGLFSLALLSKETAAAFPLLLPALDLLAPPSGRRPKRLAWAEYLAWACMAAAYFALRLALLGGLAHRGYWGGSMANNFLTMLWVAAQYLRLLVLPLWLRVDYVVPPVLSWGDWRWMAGLAAVLAVSAVAWRFRADRWPVFAWAWFLVLLLPVSNMIPIAAIMAERFLYPPMVGVALLAGWLLGGLPAMARRTVASLLFLAMAGLTARRADEWREPGRFWSIETSRSPASAIAHNNLGQHHYRQGELAAAESCFLRAVEANPGLASARASLGDVYYHTGRHRMALEQYLEYLSLNPDAPNRVQAELRMQRIRERLAVESINK